MGNGGNRFGGRSYNRGTDSLMNLYLRDALFSRMREKRQRPQQQAPAQPGMGFTVRPTEFVSSSLPSAAESAAFNERNKNRALHGDRWNTNGGIGRKGILREQMEAKALSEIAKRRLLTPYQKAQIIQKKRKNDIDTARLGFEYPEYNGKLQNDDLRGNDPLSGKSAGPPPGATTVTEQGRENVQGPANILPAAVAETQRGLVTGGQSALKDIVQSMRVVPGTVQEGLGQSPEDLNMLNMPTGGGMITRRNPDGSTEHYWTNPAGQTGRALADVVPPSRMDTAMWDGAQENQSPGLQEAVLSIMAEAGQTPAAGVNPGGIMPIKNVSLKDIARFGKRKKTKKRFIPGQSGVEMKPPRERPGRLSQHVLGGLWG